VRIGSWITVAVMAFAATSWSNEGVGKLSTGCGGPPPDAPLSVVEVDSRMREFISALPADYDPTVAHSLVFAFHGRTTPNTKVRRYFGLEEASSRPSIFVYPAALVAEDGKYSWYEPGQPGDRLRDYAFFDALLELFGDTYCIDLDRVFVVGHSLGGSFANSLGCARGAVIRGVGTVAGRIWESRCSGPSAAMIIHNPNDDLVPVSRGLHARDWALAQNGLEASGRACEPAALSCECYGSPEAADPVVWCPHPQDVDRSGRTYPHLWPTGAGAAIMGFLESLPGQ
jgi:polyhydroxybutyrate depolymerase